VSDVIITLPSNVGWHFYRCGCDVALSPGRSEHLSLRPLFARRPNAAASDRRAATVERARIRNLVRIGRTPDQSNESKDARKKMSDKGRDVVRARDQNRRRIGDRARLAIFPEFSGRFAHCVSLSDTLFAFNALNNNCDTMRSLSNSSATRVHANFKGLFKCK